jgi:hypothetical protein
MSTARASKYFGTCAPHACSDILQHGENCNTDMYVDEGRVAGRQTTENGSTYVSIDDAKVENRGGRAEKRGGSGERDGRCHGVASVQMRCPRYRNVTGAILQFCREKLEPVRLCLHFVCNCMCLSLTTRGVLFTLQQAVSCVWLLPAAVRTCSRWRRRLSR